MGKLQKVLLGAFAVWLIYVFFMLIIGMSLTVEGKKCDVVSFRWFHINAEGCKP